MSIAERTRLPSRVAMPQVEPRVTTSAACQPGSPSGERVPSRRRATPPVAAPVPPGNEAGLAGEGARASAPARHQRPPVSQATRQKGSRMQGRQAWGSCVQAREGRRQAEAQQWGTA